MKYDVTKIKSLTVEATEEVGENLAENLIRRGLHRVFVALYGDLGVGKTAFVRGFVRAISPDSVKSPTYTVVNEYRSGGIPVFHFDMYRIESADDLYSTGFYDYLGEDGFCLCEWCEKIESEIPESRISVRISKAPENENARLIEIQELI